MTSYAIYGQTGSSFFMFVIPIFAVPVDATTNFQGHKMQTSSTDTLILQCSEYCDGNMAEFYCPECSAMFCSSCYDVEHLGNQRKSQHGKLTELRALCGTHKHTLDYFNLTMLQPMCVICKKETMQAAEFEHHVVENIEEIVPKLQSLMEKKVNDASGLIDKLNSELCKAENAAKSTANAAVSYIKCAFAKLRKYLEESESELVQSAQCYFDEWRENKDFLGKRNAVKSLEAACEDGRRLLLLKEQRTMAVQFPQVFSRLNELCKKNKETTIKDMNFVVRLEDWIGKQLQGIIQSTTQTTIKIGDCVMLNELSATSLDANDSDVGSSRVWTPGRKRLSENTSTPEPVVKRRRRGGELSKEFQKCELILTELWSVDESYPFARAVDKKQSPDYYTIIKNPIDLSSMKEKLHSLQYTSAVDFVKDFRLMISNCRAYNQPDSYVYASGDQLENLFNQLLKTHLPNFEEVLLHDSMED
ncbi:uncharacterized protein [Montipora capricornis]|uniref:uncharacterized protein isoform X2 n=1 Tax=Montipora capricornis TaxID=246305 RepID=UPI0035F1514E